MGLFSDILGVQSWEPINRLCCGEFCKIRWWLFPLWDKCSCEVPRFSSESRISSEGSGHGQDLALKALCCAPDLHNEPPHKVAYSTFVLLCFIVTYQFRPRRSTCSSLRDLSVSLGSSVQ